MSRARCLTFSILIASSLTVLATTRVAPAEPASQPAPAAQGQDPDNEQFARLLEARTRYETIARNGGWPALSNEAPMKPGERYDCARVEALGKRLEIEGYRAGAGSASGEAELPNAQPTKRTEPERAGTARHPAEAG